MTVKELMKRLRKLPPESLVVLASDAECIDYHLVEVVETGWWAEYDGYGQFHEKGTVGDPEFDWEPDEDSTVAVCLIPED